MAGLVGIYGNINYDLLEQLHQIILYRGKEWKIIELAENLVVVSASDNSTNSVDELSRFMNYSLTNNTKLNELVAENFSLKRDKLGVNPLYYTTYKNNSLLFASEVKALLKVNSKIEELKPGTKLESGLVHEYFKLEKDEPLNVDRKECSRKLRDLLSNAISEKIKNKNIGAWLSGGLDSSAICALLSKQVNRLHTFAVGFLGAPDLEYAKIVANHIRSIHHERVISFADVIKVLPKVIYHLESFDALLVRSSIMNYLVAELSSDFTEEVFSGEGGDELFAGYDYIKKIPFANIPDELIDITNRLHNTALQRVDRCSSAFGLTAHVPFLNDDLVIYSLKIPTEYKIENGIEKWILRLALVEDLPTEILMRKKAKFWEGAGIGEHLHNYSEGFISDSDFNDSKKLKCGWELNSKEELLYYRVFKDYFGELDDLNWVGRTKIVVDHLEVDG